MYKGNILSHKSWRVEGHVARKTRAAHSNKSESRLLHLLSHVECGEMRSERMAYAMCVQTQSLCGLRPLDQADQCVRQRLVMTISYFCDMQGCLVNKPHTRSHALFGTYFEMVTVKEDITGDVFCM